MKWLIGAACVAIIASSGAVVWRPMYEAHQQAEAKASAKRALFAYLRLKDNDDAGALKYCRVANKNPEIFNGDTAIKIVNTCNLAGISVYY
jgi:hypothetical protein